MDKVFKLAFGILLIVFVVLITYNYNLAYQEKEDYSDNAYLKTNLGCIPTITDKDDWDNRQQLFRDANLLYGYVQRCD